VHAADLQSAADRLIRLAFQHSLRHALQLKVRVTFLTDKRQRYQISQLNGKFISIRKNHVSVFCVSMCKAKVEYGLNLTRPDPEVDMVPRPSWQFVNHGTFHHLVAP